MEAVNKAENRPLYAAREDLSEGGARHLPPPEMGRCWSSLLGIYYITPWLRWDRGPDAPDQAVLIDLANRRFYFFFIEIWPQEFYYVAGLLIMAGVGLFLVTSPSAASGAAMPARRRSGPTCSSWSSAGSRATATRASSSTPRPGRADKLAQARRQACDLAADRRRTGGAWIFYFADAPTLLRELRHRPGAARSPMSPSAS